MEEPEEARAADAAMAPVVAAAVESRSQDAPRARATGEPRVVMVAGFWRRVAQAVIDAVLVGPVALFLTWVTSKLAGITLPSARQGGPDWWFDLLINRHPAMWGGVVLFTVLVCLYLLLFQATLGRTPGMRVMKLRVVDVYGDPPGMLRSAVRTMGYVLAVLTLSLGFVWIGFDREKRGLQDWLAGTYVIVDRGGA